MIGYKCIYRDDDLLMIVIHNFVFMHVIHFFASILVHCACTFRLLLTIWDITQVDSYLLNEEGKRYKQMIWEEMNREYIEVPLLTVFSYHFVILWQIVVMHPKYNDKRCISNISLQNWKGWSLVLELTLFYTGLFRVLYLITC